MLSQSAIEQNVLCLLVYSDEHAHHVALKITDSGLFSNPTNQLIVQTSLDYITQYNAPPKGALRYLLESDLKRGEQGKLLNQTIDIIELEHLSIDAGFILEQLDNFLEHQRLTHSLRDALEILEQGDVERAKETIYRASTAPSTGSPGIWMKDPVQALSFLKKDEQTEFFSSGISVLDQRKVRPDKKTLMIIVASTGKGKSWWLVNAGKAALQHHKKILHITLELDEEKTAARYMQSMFSLTRDAAAQIPITRFMRDANGAVSMQFENLFRDSLIQKQVEMHERLSGWFSCPRWMIKQFATGMLSTEQLTMFMDGLEKKERFRPDALILDYADLMRIDAKNLRIDTGRLYREIRGLGVMKDIAILSATQGNRESETAKVVGRTNLAEDWSKAGTVDTLIAYSQTEEEKRLNLARILVDKARDVGDGFMCLITQQYSIGQFALDSVPMTASLSNDLQTMAASNGG